MATLLRERVVLKRTAVSALMVALDMLHTHKHTKMWALEVVLITDGTLSVRAEPR